MSITDKDAYHPGEIITVSPPIDIYDPIWTAHVFISPVSPVENTITWAQISGFDPSTGVSSFPAPSSPGMYAIGTDVWPGEIKLVGVITVLNSPVGTISKAGLYTMAAAGIALTILGAGVIYAYKKFRKA